VGAVSLHLFERMRDRDRQTGVVLLATLFTLALPPTLPLWHAALGMSFGIVVGKEIFGGMGRYVFHPVLVGLAFLALTYPDRVQGDAVWVAVDGVARPSTLGIGKAGGHGAILESGVSWAQAFVGHVPGPLGATSTLGCLLGAAYLVAVRVASWRILVGALAGTAATATLLSWTSAPAVAAATLPWYWHLTLGSLAFVTVFVATDRVTAAATQRGRWIHGLLIGTLAVLIRVANPVQEDGSILAVLLAGVFVPLVDHGVVRAHVRARRRRLARNGAEP